MHPLPPVSQDIASWEQWQVKTETVPTPVFIWTRSARIYDWNARRTGEWDFVHGGIDVLLEQLHLLLRQDDLLSQARAYWGICNIAELLLNFHLHSGHLTEVTNIIASHIHPDDFLLPGIPHTPGNRPVSPILEDHDDLQWEI
ncbi:hypothetical protein DACRYDRAFT_108419 [Dacryopinax primogenitus]|uniref:Uncharacterized protein n=1 Tax=Dacryopinax primogenitus (strain DJM 731) TaxID=1858805 RepID=M5FXB0_DACPD|nr:uncharacterized protein DACRYDRAFT_108419 [Dacryopinax primogenitus]EJU01089.1 hypothetical protein DACRYDRAFT_108419 [Dacryopinax primogenitus]